MAKHAFAVFRLLRRCDGPRDDPAGATVVLNDNRVEGPGCALVEAHACSKPSCLRNRRSSRRLRVPSGIDLGHYSVAAIFTSRDNREVLIACLPAGIRIVVKGRKHLPAHIHAEDGEVDVLNVITTGEVYSGGISTYGLAAARAYVAEHRAALVAEFCARNPTHPRGTQ